MNKDEKITILKNTSIFNGLSEKDIEQVAEVAKDFYYKSGEVIFEENSKADGFYIIYKGEVEILKRGSESPNEVLALKKDGDVFGEMAVIDDLPRSATIKSRTDLTLLKLSKDLFNELLNTSSHIAIEIARNICYTVRSTNINYISDLEKRNKQLKYAYQRLKKTQNEIIRLEKLSVVGKFASLIIHDIRNPMTNIRAYAELIKMSYTGDEKVQKSTGIIMEEVDRLNNMTIELLEFSRGEININKAPVNFSGFLATMIDSIKEDFKEKGIEINFIKKTESIVMLDVDKLKRVFFNLINNAKDALLTKGKIQITIEDSDKWIKWSIIDNGIGMEQEVLEKIFEPFFSRKKGGTGLGMTIVKGIIESHGGYIKVYSKINSGTKFEIFLPKA